MSDEQKLKKLTERDRLLIGFGASSNRRQRENHEAEQKRRRGPGACTWCGREPCGVLWTRPGDAEPSGDRCCDHCSHEPVEGWQHTHTAWTGLQHYPVCALVMREGETVYFRRDGVIQFIELRTPLPGSDVGGGELAHVPSVAFLGKDVSGLALHTAGEGGESAVDLWQGRTELDTAWLPIRMQAAVARDETRKERLRLEREAIEAAREAKVQADIERERLRKEAGIARKQLVHETRLVLDELGNEAAGDEPSDGEDEALIDDSDASEEALSMPELTSAAPAAEADGPVNLKAPVPVKKGPGRPKRSARQRQARQRQKRAWARQEARARLEVKRLERTSRAQPGPNLLEEDE